MHCHGKMPLFNGTPLKCFFLPHLLPRQQHFITHCTYSPTRSCVTMETTALRWDLVFLTRSARDSEQHQHDDTDHHHAGYHDNSTSSHTLPPHPTRSCVTVETTALCWDLVFLTRSARLRTTPTWWHRHRHTGYQDNSTSSHTLPHPTPPPPTPLARSCVTVETTALRWGPVSPARSARLRTGRGRRRRPSPW